VDRRGTIIQRERAAGVLTPTIQGSTHTKIENLTLYSPANRMIHWDTWGSLDLNRIDMKTCQPGIGCAAGGISSGSGTITPDLATYINISDNWVENGQFSIHDGSCASNGLVRMWFTGNTFGAWRYSPESKDADTTVSGAQMVALFAARNAGCIAVAATWGTLDEELLLDTSPPYVARRPVDVLQALAVPHCR